MDTKKKYLLGIIVLLLVVGLGVFGAKNTGLFKGSVTDPTSTSPVITYPTEGQIVTGILSITTSARVKGIYMQNSAGKPVFIAGKNIELMDKFKVDTSNFIDGNYIVSYKNSTGGLAGMVNITIQNTTKSKPWMIVQYINTTNYNITRNGDGTLPIGLPVEFFVSQSLINKSLSDYPGIGKPLFRSISAPTYPFMSYRGSYRGPFIDTSPSCQQVGTTASYVRYKCLTQLLPVATTDTDTPDSNGQREWNMLLKIYWTMTTGDQYVETYASQPTKIITVQ